MPYTGFTIDDLYSNAGGGRLLDVLEQRAAETGFDVLGWCLSFDFSDPTPLSIVQFIRVTDANAAGLPLGYRTVDANATPPYADLTGAQLISSGRKTATVVPINRRGSSYLNRIGTALGPMDRDAVRNIEHYSYSSRMFFFSTDQLITAKKLREELVSQGVDADLIFSGYSMRTGRMTSEVNGRELHEISTRFNDLIQNSPLQGISISEDRFSNWFSLKLEVVADTAPVGTFEASVPMAFFAHPCPPSWHTSSILYAIFANSIRFNFGSNLIDKTGAEIVKIKSTLNRLTRSLSNPELTIEEVEEDFNRELQILKERKKHDKKRHKILKKGLKKLNNKEK